MSEQSSGVREPSLLDARSVLARPVVLPPPGGWTAPMAEWMALQEYAADIPAPEPLLTWDGCQAYVLGVMRARLAGDIPLISGQLQRSIDWRRP